jgi:hypothetical protein
MHKSRSCLDVLRVVIFIAVLFYRPDSSIYCILRVSIANKSSSFADVLTDILEFTVRSGEEFFFAHRSTNITGGFCEKVSFNVFCLLMSN